MTKKVKIVTFDLETIWDAKQWMREDRAFGMSNWEGRSMKANINSIITFGYQINDEEPQTISVWDFDGYHHSQVNDDYLLCQMAYDILHDADAVITHNGKRFDWKFLKTRLKIHRLNKLPKIAHIDTCQEAKKHYSFFSNRLKDLADELGVSAKISTGGKSLWTRVYQGDVDAEVEMAEYCKGDVRATYECAIDMQDEITNWPNYNIYNDTLLNCPNINCGSLNIQKHGVRQTKTALKQRFRCQDCGTIHERPQGKIARSSA